MRGPLVKVNGKVRAYDFSISEFPASPDGYSRNIYGINGQYPGPPIVMNKGDKALVRVENHLHVPTSIHFHGMYQRGTPWNDGVTGGTQCPIPVSDSYTYSVDTGDQSGTTWYHSHTSSQYSDGVLGPLIIQDPDDPNKHLYDEEIIVILTDWYHTPTHKLLKAYLAPESNGNSPSPDSVLINGKGRFNCTSLHDAGLEGFGRCEPDAPRESFHFVPGRRYRIRIINASNDSAFTFSIDGHRLTLIETDMTPVQPHTVDRLSIHVAQRYSVVVEADAAVDNYWMRAELSDTCMFVHNPLLDRMGLAEIRYDGSPEGEPTSKSVHEVKEKECVDLDYRSLIPIEAQEAEHPSKRYVLNFYFNPDEKGVRRGYVNNSTYAVEPYNPVLNKVFDDVRTFKKSESVIVLEKDEIIELVLNNFWGREHPFHLHGHEFQVLSWNTSSHYDPHHSPTAYNLENPIRRDTTTVPARGYSVIRFRSNNPGVWAFHCHIEWHLEDGLLVNFIEQPSKIERMRPPRDVLELCNSPHVPMI
ncbi:MAG: Cupredoxin [Piptocephalis tieghemiana]|nr:MAG: Cupredoxin [Piptocephalis tieghemiana]